MIAISVEDAYPKDDAPIDTLSDSDDASVANGASVADDTSVMGDSQQGPTGVDDTSAMDAGDGVMYEPTGADDTSAMDDSLVADDTSVASDASDGSVASGGYVGTTSYRPVYKNMWLRSRTTMDKTSSTSWTDISGMTLNVDVRRSSDFIIMYSSEVMTTDNTNVRVRALVDGKVAYPGDVYFAYKAGDDQTHSFNFYVRDLERGRHTVKMQWKVNTGGEEYATAWYRSLAVMIDN